MQIQSTILKSQINSLSKENAFLKLKINLLQQHKPLSQITIINKQLYLNYMQDVLSYKQKQLLATQKKLQDKNIHLINRQAQIKLINPLQKSTQIDIFLKKIQEIKSLLVDDEFIDNSSFQIQQWRQFMKKQSQIVEECRNYQKQTQNLIKNQYQNLIRQRKQFAQSMDKFEELHSYQKYLNQLQTILQAKQNEVLQKQDDLYTIKHQQRLQMPPGCLSFGRQNYSVKEPSQKKRLKIFQSVHKSQGPKFFQQYQSSKSSANQRFSNLTNQSNSIQIQKDQSSFIMQQAQTNQNDTVKKCEKCTHQNFQTLQAKYSQSIGIQTKIQLANESIERLQRDKKLYKFAHLWLKHSINSKKTASATCKKTIGFYLWRLNAVYDPQLPDHLKKTYNWPIKYQESLKDQQLFPYTQLSMNRKKYAQLTLDYERKLLHQNKIKNSLKNIIRNKNVKERITLIYYFKKYSENSKIKTILQLEKALSITTGNKISGKQTTIMDPTSRYHTQSHLVSVKSSRIMNEQRAINDSNREILKDQRKSKVQLNPKSMSSSNLHNFSQQKVTKGLKQNISPSQSLDAKKLKEYIRSHEQAQKALATQCVKTEALCQLSQTLIGCVNKPIINGFYSIKQLTQNERVIQLQRRINKYEFKWQLFMTKCKLALVNNNNKISYLEDNLSFMFTK